MEVQYRLYGARNPKQGSAFGIPLRTRRRRTKYQTFTHEFGALIFCPKGDEGTLINLDKHVRIKGCVMPAGIKRTFAGIQMDRSASHDAFVFASKDKKLCLVVNHAKAQKVVSKGFQKSTISKVRDGLGKKVLSAYLAFAVSTTET